MTLYLAATFAAQLMSAFMLPARPAFGQEKTLRVWEKEPPGALTSPSYRPDTVYIDGNRIRLTRIVDPTLDVYPAPRDLANGAAIVVCPGGGYSRLAVDHEGSLVATWLNSLGITACVLKYRLPDDEIMMEKSVGPLQDGLEAIRVVRRHAGAWGIAPNKIGIMGFSAGGHLASTVSTHFAADVYEPSDTISARPDFTILIYPVISMESTITHRGSRNNLIGENPSPEVVRDFSSDRCVSGNTPPAFIAHALDDRVVPVENSVRYMMALRDHGIPCEAHIYQSGGHGFGLGRQEGTESTWPEACKRWLHQRGITSPGG